MKTHSDFYIMWRVAYAIAIGALALQWSTTLGMLAFLIAGVLAIACYAVERWIVRREDLHWAAEQVRPLIFHQAHPLDRSCRLRADSIRQLLRDAENENLIIRDQHGNETAIKVYEVYFRDEYNMTETWPEYLARVDAVRIEMERKQLVYYRENNLQWVLERWFDQQTTPE